LSDQVANNGVIASHGQAECRVNNAVSSLQALQWEIPITAVFIFNVKNTKAIMKKLSNIFLGPNYALWPNFKPIGSEFSTKNAKKQITPSKQYAFSSAMLSCSAVASGMNKNVQY
jgi:hypothetical protein